MSNPARIQVVDTILGPQRGTTPTRAGGELAHLLPDADGPSVVIARGCVSPDDGGGGVFAWRASSLADDGGTVIRPPGTKEYAWFRLYSGPLDIRWFGAQGTKVVAGVLTEDTWAIANAIAASCGSGPARGVEIYVPPGQFFAQLTLPRLGTMGGSIRIRGAGINLSCIQYGSTEGVATVEFSHRPPAVKHREPSSREYDEEYAMHYAFSSITFRAMGAGGTAFRHAPALAGKPSTPFQLGRLDYATFRDVLFQSDSVDKGDPPVAEMRALFDSRLEGVAIRGSGGLFVSGARNHLIDVRTLVDKQQTNGIVLEDSGESVIDSPRIDGLFGNTGDGIRLTRCSAVSIRNASFEGKEGRSCIRIEDCSNVKLDNCNLGGGPTDQTVQWAALWLTGNTDRVLIEGGRINVVEGTQRGVCIESNVRSVHGTKIEASSRIQQSAAPPFLDIHPEAEDIRLDFVFGREGLPSHPSYARAEFMATTGTGKFSGTTLLLGRHQDLRISGTHTIEDIAQGGTEIGLPAPVGRRVLLYLEGGEVTISHGTRIHLEPPVAWKPGPGRPALLELVFTGSWWQQLCRVG